MALHLAVDVAPCRDNNHQNQTANSFQSATDSLSVLRAGGIVALLGLSSDERPDHHRNAVECAGNFDWLNRGAKSALGGGSNSLAFHVLHGAVG